MHSTVVVGGGIGGLATAIALQQRDVDAVVYERADAIEPAGVGIGVPTNGMAALDRLGLAEAVEARGVPLAELVLRSPDGTVLRTDDLSPLVEQFGHSTVSIRRTALREILVDALEPGTLRLGKRCVGFDQSADGVTVRFADGTEAAGDVLVGADGIRSAIREELFPASEPRHSGETCYGGVADFDLPRSIERTSWDVWGGAAEFSFAPVAPGRVTWYAPITGHEKGRDEEATATIERLCERYADFPDPIPTLLANTDAESVIHTDLADVSPLETWWHGRTVLLGDAAHAALPSLGQGAAQALEDALVLADELVDSDPSNPSAAFRAYERARKPRAETVVSQARRVEEVAHLTDERARWVRDFTIRHTPSFLNRRRRFDLVAPQV